MISRQKTKPIVLIIITVMILSSQLALGASNESEYFVSPLTGERYLVYKNSISETLTYTSESGLVFESKGEILRYEMEQSPDVNFKLDRYLRDLVEDAKANESIANKTVSVIIEFREQPVLEISGQVHAEYEPRFDNITRPAEGIYARVRPLMGDEKELSSKNISELIALEKSLLTQNEKKTLERVGVELKSAKDQMRGEIISRSTPLTDEIQAPVIEKLRNRNYSGIHGLKVYNALFAEVPVNYLEELSSDPSIFKVYHSSVFQSLLDNTVCSTGADTWQSLGYDGTPFSVAIVDTGIDIDHPALVDYQTAGRYWSKVFHDYGKNKSEYDDDPNDDDDFVNHGTPIAGVIKSYDSTYKGMASNPTASQGYLMNIKAGWKNTAIDGAMFKEEDIAIGIDYALRDSASPSLPDVISLSFGATDQNDGNSYITRFLDSVAYSFQVTVVVAAGNTGPFSGSINRPGDGFNSISVGAVDDKNDCNTNNDEIWNIVPGTRSSSRGPTFDNRRKPDIVAPGYQVKTTNSKWETLFGAYPDFTDEEGTSIAAPHVSGGALLVMDYKNDKWTPQAIKALLMNSAKDDGPYSSAPDNTFGWGYLDLGDAYIYRDDVFTDIIFDKPEGLVEKFYKGPYYALERATLVWNRHVLYNEFGDPPHFLTPRGLC